MRMEEDGYNTFYDRQYSSDEGYADKINMQDSPFYDVLIDWLRKNKSWEKKRFLEIGSGRGALQDVVNDYTGLDYSSEVKRYYHKSFVNGSATEMPFADNEFDVTWSYAVWEHIPDPEKALEETVRVLKDKGRKRQIIDSIDL